MEQAIIEQLSQQVEQAIQDKALVLPVLSQVTSNVLTLVNDINSDASSLAQLIQSDQSLAGHVMRIANSAAYSPNAKMTSLQQAIARLGMQNIAEIAMAATMGPKLFVAPGFEQVIKELWESSLATAVWSREIARVARRNVESTFLCGLLYQIGRPAVLQVILEFAAKNDIKVKPECANLMMSAYQRPVGLMMAEQWQLPKAVTDTISHIDSKGESEGSAEIVDAVRSGRVFAAGAKEGNYDADAIGGHPSVIAMNLYADDVEQLIERADVVQQTIEALKL